MPRNMSFFYTQQQVRDETKDVTRRKGWADLKPGDLFWAVETAQGLGKGGKIVRLKLCRCVSNTPSVLYNIKPTDVRREGFPDMTPVQFVRMFQRHMGGEPDQTVNRIVFTYVKDPVTLREAWHPQLKRRKRKASGAHA